MTDKKYISGDVHPDDAHGSASTVVEASHPAETEKPVVGQADAPRRRTAEEVVQTISADDATATAQGNSLTLKYKGPNGLVQTFIVTVTEGIREF